ncbi:DUF6221 family protein [Nocardia sp. NPDC019395]|uniref:DUF6221 family protein n=1 Tax=Nocardia sp. NPDC019395 TaxID=3154686 RepID=UPI0033F6EB07
MTERLAHLLAGLDSDESLARGALDPKRMPEAMTHVQAHEPARVLRQVEAIRKITTEFEDTRDNAGLGDFDGGYASALEYVVKALASIYP